MLGFPRGVPHIIIYHLFHHSINHTFGRTIWCSLLSGKKSSVKESIDRWNREAARSPIWRTDFATCHDWGWILKPIPGNLIISWLKIFGKRRGTPGREKFQGQRGTILVPSHPYIMIPNCPTSSSLSLTSHESSLTFTDTTSLSFFFSMVYCRGVFPFLCPLPGFTKFTAPHLEDGVPLFFFFIPKRCCTCAASTISASMRQAGARRDEKKTVCPTWTTCYVWKTAF